VAVAVAQTSVTWDIAQNLAGIAAWLDGARASEIVVQPAVLRTVIDTEDISDWYLSQRRTDLLHLRYQGS